MKKLIIIFSLLLVPLGVNASFDIDLIYGLQGNNKVKELQEFLKEQKIYNGPITGNFFSLTLKAVRDFQKRENITPISGFFGPLTRIKANEILSVSVKSSDQRMASENYNVSTTPELFKINNNIIESLQDQITLLLQRIQNLQTEQTILNKPQLNNQEILQNTTLSDCEISTDNQDNLQSCAIPLTLSKIRIADTTAHSVRFSWETSQDTYGIVILTNCVDNHPDCVNFVLGEEESQFTVKERLTDEAYFAERPNRNYTKRHQLNFTELNLGNHYYYRIIVINKEGKIVTSPNVIGNYYAKF